MQKLKVTSLFLLLLTSHILLAGKVDLIDKIESTDSINVFFVNGHIDAEGVNGSCKGIQDEMDIPKIYKQTLLKEFVQNLSLDYKTQNLFIDTNSYNQYNLKDIDSSKLKSSFFITLELSGTYYTEQDFSSNQAGFHLSYLTLRANIKCYELNEKGIPKVIGNMSKELCNFNSEKAEHTGCMASVHDFPKYINPSSLLSDLSELLSKEQNKKAKKDWKKHK